MNKLFVITFVFALFMGACGNVNTASEEDTDNVHAVEKKEIENDALITTSLTNEDGVTMYMTFNNEQGILLVKMYGETVELRQVPTASGIKYVNDYYEFNQWHGETLFTKEGKVIFEYKE